MRDCKEVNGSEREGTTSSACKLILYSTSPILIPDMCWCKLIVWARDSIISTNIIGESGQPCLVSLVIGLERTPEVRTLADGLEYRVP